MDGGMPSVTGAPREAPEPHLACSRVEVPSSPVGEGGKPFSIMPQVFPSWCPTKLVVNGEHKEFPLPQVPKKYNFQNGSGMRYEAIHVRECLRKGKNVVGNRRGQAWKGAVGPLHPPSDLKWGLWNYISQDALGHPPI